jgi:hypothetical protein
MTREQATSVEERGAPAEAAREPQAETQLFSPEATRRYRDRWREIQARFVDDPKDAVKSADELVDELVDDLSRSFSEQRAALEGRWENETEITTEDLRQALHRYRSFFSRLLTI